MKLMIQRSSYALFLFMLVACAQLGLQAPETFKEKVAAAASVNTTIRQTATSLLNSGKLTAADGQNILAQTDNARAGIDVAVKLSDTDLSAAENRIGAIRTALTALSAYLATKK